MYNLDENKLAIWHTPYLIRQTNWRLLMSVLTSPLDALVDTFTAFRAAKMYRFSHNSQTCYLRAVLNDSLDSYQRRITITDFSNGRDRIFFWPQTSERDVNFGSPVYFWPNDQYSDSGLDFTVNIPTDVATTDSGMALLKALLNEYKLAGKKYNIVRN